MIGYDDLFWTTSCKWIMVNATSIIKQYLDLIYITPIKKPTTSSPVECMTDCRVRYELRYGRFGAYYFDNIYNKDLTLNEVLNLLLETKKRTNRR